MAIDFTKPNPPLAKSRFVRFYQDVDDALVEISDGQDIDIAQVIRTLTKVGLDEYRKQKEIQDAGN